MDLDWLGETMTFCGYTKFLFARSTYEIYFLSPLYLNKRFKCF